MSTSADNLLYEEHWQRKLTGFHNWEQWSNLTQLTLEEKGVWDIVEETWAVTNTNEYWKNRATAAQIIKEEADDNLFKSIWDIKDSHNI